MTPEANTHAQEPLERQQKCRVVGRLLRSIGDDLERNHAYQARPQNNHLLSLFLVTVELLGRLYNEVNHDGPRV